MLEGPDGGSGGELPTARRDAPGWEGRLHKRYPRAPHPAIETKVQWSAAAA